MIDSEVLRHLAEAAATEAGALLLEGLATERTVVATKSTATDLVTEYDRRVEELITARLLAERPDDGILGEEGTAVEGVSGVRWIIDPLDGTTNYLYGLPGFNVSIAAEFEGEVLAGVVADPMHDEVFTASSGDVARCNGRPISGSGADRLAHALVATGFSYDAARRGRQAGVLAVVLPRVRDLRRGGAAAVDLCWVACGRLDGYWERGLAPWDHAAGGYIAARAGATVSNLSGGDADGDFTFASAPGVADGLRALLIEARADDV